MYGTTCMSSSTVHRWHRLFQEGRIRVEDEECRERLCDSIKPCIHERTKWFANRSWMVCEPNESMCGWDCEPALCRPRMICIPFTANRNLLVFCTNTKRTGCVGCPFHALGVLCSPQVRKKLINHAPNMSRMRTAQRISDALAYTRFYRREHCHCSLTTRTRPSFNSCTVVFF